VKKKSFMELERLPTDLDERFYDLPIEKFWCKLQKNDNKVTGAIVLENLASFMFKIMILPYTTASVEGAFSSMANAKTKRRN